MKYTWVVASRSLLNSPIAVTKRIKVEYDDKNTVYDALQEVGIGLFGLYTNAVICETPYGEALQNDMLLKDIRSLQNVGKILYARSTVHDLDTRDDHLKSKFLTAPI